MTGWGRKKSFLLFVGLPADSSNCTWANDFRRKVRHQSGSSPDPRGWSAWRFALRAGFREKSALHPAKLPFGLWRHYVGWVCSYLWQHHQQCCFWTWSHVKTVSCAQLVAEVCACVNQAVDRRRAVKDSQIQWYAVGGLRPSSEDSASWSSVRISKKVEEGRVEYVPVRTPSFSVPGPSNLRVSSEKSEKRKVSRSPVKRRFEIASPPVSSQQHLVVEDLGFSAALDRQQSCRNSRRSGRNFFAVVYRHLQYETVSLLLSRLCWHLCSWLVQTNKKKING